MTKEQKATSIHELACALAAVVCMVIYIVGGVKWFAPVYFISVAACIYILISDFTEYIYGEPTFVQFVRAVFFIGFGPFTLLSLVFQTILIVFDGILEVRRDGKQKKT